ncbi:uncharacterized mitochondrial protein AtMg00860-like [Nicotiana sylvestris]|uniref:uncharacterized mitochondrial protein AtMg00860-like n=1 Tax=Nicotiana sylvestris TaxID=4096 RepID=UPI00388C9251
MIHKEIEVYVDDVIIKSKKQSDHVKDLSKFFQRLRRYNLKLNPTKCAFGVPFGKLLGFVVSRHGIELDPSKIKAIQELPPPKNKTEVMILLGRLNYISRFIAQLTTTCEPIFKLLKKNVAVKWPDVCQEAFDKIKRTIEFRHIPRVHNEIVDALATLESMLHHRDKDYVDPVHIQVCDQHAYCNVFEEEIDSEPWFHDIKEYIKSGIYPVHATSDQKRTI